LRSATRAAKHDEEPASSRGPRPEKSLTPMADGPPDLALTVAESLTSATKAPRDGGGEPLRAATRLPAFTTTVDVLELVCDLVGFEDDDCATLMAFRACSSHCAAAVNNALRWPRDAEEMIDDVSALGVAARLCVVSQRHGAHPYWLRDIPATLFAGSPDRASDLQTVLQHVPQPTSLEFDLWAFQLVPQSCLAHVRSASAKLTSLRMKQCNETDLFFSSCLSPGMLGLQCLELVNCWVRDGDAVLAEIAPRCPQLRHLELCDVPIRDRGITAVARHCQMLRRLDVRKCRAVADESVAMIATHCPQLEHLDARETNVTDESISLLAQQCTMLKYLCLSETTVSDSSVSLIARHCPDLEHLSLSDTQVTDASLSLVAQRCVNLRHLDVERVSQVTDASILEVVNRCSTLTHLELSDTGKGAITDASLGALGEKCPELRWLGVRHARGVTTATIVGVANICRQLRHLDVADSDAATHTSVLHVARNCKQLEHLCVSWPNMDDDPPRGNSIRALTKNCPWLVHFEVSMVERYRKSIEAAIEAAKRALPDLDIEQRGPVEEEEFDEYVDMIGLGDEECFMR